MKTSLKDHGAILNTTASPGSNFFLSNDAHAGLLVFAGISTLTLTCSRHINDLNDSECGHIGVNKIPRTYKFHHSCSSWCYYKTIQICRFYGKSWEGAVILKYMDGYSNIILFVSPILCTDVLSVICVCGFFGSNNYLLIYIYIYMCVCVCVCVVF